MWAATISVLSRIGRRRGVISVCARRSLLPFALGIAIMSSPAFAGWLGVEIRNLSPAQARLLGIDPRQGAAEIAEVQPGGPAARAGIEAGDIIVVAGGSPVRGAIDLLRVLRAAPVGARLTFTILRNHREMSISAIVGERPPQIRANMQSKPCVAGGICCASVGYGPNGSDRRCGTLEEFQRYAKIVCLKGDAIENKSLPQSIETAGRCIAARIAAERVEAAQRQSAADHQRAVNARRQLGEMGVDPDH